MPKYFVTASEVIFYRGVVEVANENELHQVDLSEEELEEYDTEAMQLQTYQQVEKD